MRLHHRFEFAAVLAVLAIGAAPVAAQTERGPANEPPEPTRPVVRPTRARPVVHSAEGVIVMVHRAAAQRGVVDREPQGTVAVPNGLMEVTIRPSEDWDQYTNHPAPAAAQPRRTAASAVTGPGDLRVWVTPQTRLRMHYRTADGIDVEGEPSAPVTSAAATPVDTAAGTPAHPRAVLRYTEPQAGVGQEDVTAETAASLGRPRRTTSTPVGAGKAADARATGVPPHAVIEGSATATNTGTAHEVASPQSEARGPATNTDVGAGPATTSPGSRGRVTTGRGPAIGAAVGTQAYGTETTRMRPRAALVRLADIHDGQYVTVRYRTEPTRQNIALNLNVIRPAHEPGGVAETDTAVEPGARTTTGAARGRVVNPSAGAATRNTNLGRTSPNGRTGGQTGSTTDDLPGGTHTP